MYNVKNLSKVWRRPLTPSSDYLEAPTLGADGQSIKMNKLNIKEGEWVTLDSEDKAIKAATPTKIAYPVFTGGGEDGTRGDAIAAESLTVACGPHIAETSVFNADGSYEKDTELTVRDGKLDVANAEYDEAVVAVVEAVEEHAQYANGILRIKVL